MNSIELSLIIVNYNTASGTAACIEALQKYGLGKQQEIIVVDNASSDGSVQLLYKRFPSITVIASKENLGFAKGCNLGVRSAKGRYLGFINSDCITHKGALQRLVQELDSNQAASVVIPKLLEEDGSIQHNIAPLPTLRGVADGYLFGKMNWPDMEYLSKPTAVEVCSGAALVIRAEDYREIGGFDESYFMYMEDVELCWRLNQAGKSLFFLPDAVMDHQGGGSSKTDRIKLNKMLHDNYKDYIRRHFDPVSSVLAIAAIDLGLVIFRIKAAVKRLIGVRQP